MGNSVLVVTKQDAGREIRLRVGESFDVEVNDVSTTGYRWSAAGVDNDHLKLTYEEMKPHAALGGERKRRFTYEALSPGVTTLTFILKRAWESKALEEFSIRVRVEAKTSS